MKFVLLIACRSGSETLKDTLESISNAILPKELEKVIIIENSGGSNLERTVLAFREKIPVEYLHTSKKGKSVALNMAIRDCIPDDSFILFTDDDVRVNKKWMMNYAEFFLKYGSGHYFGSAMGVDYEEEPDQALKRWFPPSARGRDDSVYRSNRKVYFLGCNWAAHKSDLVRAGLFHEEYGIGSKINSLGEEALIQMKLDKLNATRVLIPNNYVWHKVPKDRSSWQWLKYRYERMGKTAYQIRQKKIFWILKNGQCAVTWFVKSLNWEKENFYRFILQLKKIEGFLKAALYFRFK